MRVNTIRTFRQIRRPRVRRKQPKLTCVGLPSPVSGMLLSSLQPLLLKLRALQLLWPHSHLPLGPDHDGPHGPPSDQLPESQGDPVARANVTAVSEGCEIEHTDHALPLLLLLNGESVGFDVHARQLCQHEWVQLVHVGVGEGNVDGLTGAGRQLQLLLQRRPQQPPPWQLDC